MAWTGCGWVYKFDPKSRSENSPRAPLNKPRSATTGDRSMSERLRASRVLLPAAVEARRAAFRLPAGKDFQFRTRQLDNGVQPLMDRLDWFSIVA